LAAKFKKYKNIIFPVVLCGCKTWSLTFREERRLRVFENRELRRIFGPKRDEVTEEWRKLHNEDLHDLYTSPNIVRVIKSRRMRWAVHVARIGEGRGIAGLWWGNLKEREHWGDPGVDGRIRHIKMDLQVVGCGVRTALSWFSIVTGGGLL
jgi:hypothetical protein